MVASVSRLVGDGLRLVPRRRSGKRLERGVPAQFPRYLGGLAGVGYTCFAIAMTIGRLCGDRLADRWGPRLLVRVSSAAAALGWSGALILNSPDAALAGLMLLGFGLSSVVPNVFSQASRLGQAGPSIAVVTFCGYGGMLAGPAVIGTLAGAVGLPAALSVDAGLATTIFLLCGVLALRPLRVASP